MRILLTGGTGLIGRALCQHWQRQGHDLFVWSRDPAQVPRLCSGAQGIAHTGCQAERSNDVGDWQIHQRRHQGHDAGHEGLIGKSDVTGPQFAGHDLHQTAPRGG